MHKGELLPLHPLWSISVLIPDVVLHFLPGALEWIGFWFSNFMVVNGLIFGRPGDLTQLPSSDLMTDRLGSKAH